MKLEEDLPDAMRDSVQGVRPDVAALVSGGIERGRRGARRARIARLVGTTCVLALVGGLAISLAQGGSPKQGEQQEQQVATTRIEAPTTTPAPPPKVRITEQALLQLLIDELPEGAKTSKYGGIAQKDWVEAQLIWTTPKGDSRVAVSIVFDDRNKTSPGWPDDAVCAPENRKDHIPFCDVQHLRDGTRLILETADYPDGRKDQLNTAVHTRTDHVEISVTASGTDKLAPPPLTIKQLAKLVMDSAWQAKVDKAFADAAMKRFGDLPTDPMHPEWPDSK